MTKHLITRLADGKWAYVDEDEDSFNIILRGQDSPESVRQAVRDSGCDDSRLVTDYGDDYSTIR